MNKRAGGNGRLWHHRRRYALSLKSVRARSNRNTYYAKLMLGQVRDYPRAWLANVLLADEKVADTTGAKLIGINIKNKGSKWVIILTRTYRGKKYVGFQNGESLRDALYLLGYALPAKAIKWRASKY